MASSANSGSMITCADDVVPAGAAGNATLSLEEDRRIGRRTGGVTFTLIDAEDREEETFCGC